MKRLILSCMLAAAMIVGTVGMASAHHLESNPELAGFVMTGMAGVSHPTGMGGIMTVNQGPTIGEYSNEIKTGFEGVTAPRTVPPSGRVAQPAGPAEKPVDVEKEIPTGGEGVTNPAP